MAGGLRERKKERTRRLIAETARALFDERGFDDVPVAEVARAADVSEKTVFNYFPAKEDLVFWGRESFEEEMAAAIRDRPSGESALEAFARFVLAAREPPEVARMIEASPALRAREQLVLARHTAALAGALAEASGAEAGDPEPRVAANAMIGVYRDLVSHARRRAADGAGEAAVSREIGARGRRAVALLEEGLGHYAIKPG